MGTNTEGRTPVCSLARGLSVYPGDATLEEMTETAVLLEAELDAADPNDGDMAAWVRHTHGPLN